MGFGGRGRLGWHGLGLGYAYAGVKSTGRLVVTLIELEELIEVHEDSEDEEE